MAMSDYAGQRGGLPLGLPFWRELQFRREAAKIAPFLDAQFYLENNADVASAGLDASLHYVKYGWREGRDPSPSFSTSGYLAANPSVAVAGLNPLLHFVQDKSAISNAAHAKEDTQLATEIDLIETHLDTVFYEKAYPGAARSKLSAAEHFCRFGWRDGHDPGPDFSTSYYLTTNPDVRDSGLNPYWHYLIAGREEGRLGVHPGGWKHGVLARQTNFETHCDGWQRDEALPELLNGEALASRILDARCAEAFMVSIGHDDYRSTPGGVQLCIQIEERDARAHGYDYLNLHPWQPLPKLAPADGDGVLCVIFNGAYLGAARASEVLASLPLLSAAMPARLVVHHLAGHAPETILAIAEGFAVSRAHLWLHDYFTLCTSYALQRNNVMACDAPEVGSNACNICLFGKERLRQKDRIAALFNALDVTLVSPSQVALDFWEARSDLRTASVTVHPHVRLIESDRAYEPAVAADTPVRIGFIGTPVPHKGWPIFRELQRRLDADDGYEFWFFGMSAPDVSGVQHVSSHVRADAPDSTTQAVAEHEIDLVLHWAAWRETFSFSTFEALAGGAFVVTNAGSGNVAAAVEALDCGVVLDTADALYKLAEEGGLKALASGARGARARRAFTAEFSGMTHDLYEDQRRG